MNLFLNGGLGGTVKEKGKRSKDKKKRKQESKEKQGSASPSSTLTVPGAAPGPSMATLRLPETTDLSLLAHSRLSANVTPLAFSVNFQTDLTPFSCVTNLPLFGHSSPVS